MRRSDSAEIGPVKELAAQVEGWLTDAEAQYLYQAAKNCRGDGVIVEVGSWKGKSTIWLAKGSKAGNNVKIYAIDPHTGSSVHRDKYGKVRTLDEFQANIKRANVADIIVPLVKTSQDAEQDWHGKPVELLWIDGDHDYEMVALDLTLWSQYLIEGGTIAFHDTIFWHGPKKVVRDKICNSHAFAVVGFVDSITFARKVRANTLVTRLRNQWVLFLKNIFESGISLHLPTPVGKMAKKILKLVQ